MTGQRKTIQVVIGSQYGDEGKGLTVDYLASKHPKSVVTRFCGGAQASHSVVRDGKRHAFRHFGSNSFLPNSVTYLSKFFICNPYIFEDEILDLEFLPHTLAHPMCIITTCVDMLINQHMERLRGHQRHGSCGLGINETVERNNSGFNLTLQDILHRDLLINKLVGIRDEWLPSRLREHGITNIPPIFNLTFEHWSIEQEADMLIQIYSNVPTLASGLLDEYHHIFEGSQGLLLSEKWCHETPHVTRAYTGMRNVVELTKQDDVAYDIYYVSRVYVTRHGAGPLPHEVDGLIYPAVDDPNNIPNQFQGTIRMAPLDLKNLHRSVMTDLNDELPVDSECTVNLMFTCVDQLPDNKIRYIDMEGDEVEASFDEFVGKVRVAFDFPIQILASYGPSAETVVIK